MMGQWPGVFCVTNTVFGRYACILSGGTWTRDRHSRAGFDVDPCCPVCRDTRETPIHKWRVCPGCCGHAPGETCLKTPRARSWPSRGPPLTGSPNARGSAVSSPRRPTETAPPRPRTRRVAASPSRGCSLGNIWSTVGFHNFNLQIFNLRISNHNKLIMNMFLTRYLISTCKNISTKKL